MKQIPLVSLMLVILLFSFAKADVPLMSHDELKSESSHIVIGNVRAVYSTTEKSKNWQDTSFIAEISLVSVEKGAGLHVGEVIYAHYWKKRWIGKGNPDPHASGHSGVSKGDVVRAFLQRKDSAYHVLLPNGFASAKAGESEKKPTISDVAAQELAAVQGKWFRTVETDRGTFKIEKEHKGNTTILTITDAEGEMVEQKESEFRIETTGKARVFTFFNNVFTAGPNKGRKDDTPQSYIYRITDDTFAEIRGVLIGDGDRLAAFTWQRVKE